VCCREKRTDFDVGSMLAIDRSEMKTTRQRDGLGRNRWFDNITREMPSIARHRHSMDERAVTVPAVLIQIGCQEESR
jgi:hypothetical protein